MHQLPGILIRSEDGVLRRERGEAQGRGRGGAAGEVRPQGQGEARREGDGGGDQQDLRGVRRERGRVAVGQRDPFAAEAAVRVGAGDGPGDQRLHRGRRRRPQRQHREGRALPHLQAHLRQLLMIYPDYHTTTLTGIILIMENRAEPRPLPQHGQFLATIRDREHKLVKFISPESVVMAQKIVYVGANQERWEGLVREQMERVKQYLVRKLQLESMVKTLKFVEVKEKPVENQAKYFKTDCKYYQYPDLNRYYVKQNVQGIRRNRRDEEVFFYMCVTFELVLRGGGIDYYFYTPQNVFRVPSRLEERPPVYGPLLLNPTSFTGSRLIFMPENTILACEMEEIYPLLPPDFFKLKEAGQYRKIDRLIKKRGFMFLLMVQLLQQVPTMLKLDNLYETLNQAKIQGLLDNSVEKFKTCINAKLFQKPVEGISALLGVDFIALFKEVFVECRELSWDEIHRRLFLQNKFTRQEYHRSTSQSTKHSFERQKMSEFRTSLQHMWEKEKTIKRSTKDPSKKKERREKMDFYIERDFVRVNSQTHELQPDSGMVYFLIRTNVAFHKVLRHASPLHFIAASEFGQEVMEMTKEMIIAEYNDAAQDILQKQSEQEEVHPSPNMQAALREVVVELRESEEASRLLLDSLGEGAMVSAETNSDPVVASSSFIQSVDYYRHNVMYWDE